MRVKDLIAKLQEFDGELPVELVDQEWALPEYNREVRAAARIAYSAPAAAEPQFRYEREAVVLS